MRGRTIVLLLGAVFIGTPLALIWLFVKSPDVDRVTVGAQPGGRAIGVVRDARGAAASGATIEAFLAQPRHGERSLESDVEHPPELVRRPCAATVAGTDCAF